MMKKVTLFLVIFLLIPSVFASVSVTIYQSEFNLGDKLSADVEINEEDDLVNGFFRLSVVCDGHNTLKYYKEINLWADEIKKIKIQGGLLFEDLIGECYLDGVLESSRGDTIDQGASALFVVSNALDIFLLQSSFTVNPGEEINLNGAVKKTNGDNADNAEITLVLDEKTQSFSVSRGVIDYNMKVPADIKSQIHYMDIIAEDEHGNNGKEVVELNVNPVATTIQIILNKELFIPSETLQVEITILDQAGDFMDGVVNFEIINPENGKIHLEEVRSDGIVQYNFEQNAMPGKYELRSFIDNVLKEDIIIMQEYEKLEISLEGSEVYVENIGNIKYNKKTTIILEDEENNEFVVLKRIKLDVGEFMGFDLSREVPDGNYLVNLGEELVGDVPIEDNRNMLKKTEHAVNKITGNAIGPSGFMSTSLASIIILAIILSMLVYVNRKKIKKLVNKE